jgi:hypothetical protein
MAREEGAMHYNNQYVILEWIPYAAEFPRYSFATVKHAEELGSQVQRLRMCPSLEVAAEAVHRLNLSDTSADNPFESDERNDEH